MEMSLEQQISDLQKKLREQIDNLGIVEDEMDKLDKLIVELRLKKCDLKPSLTMATRNVKKTRSEIKQMEHDFWRSKNQ